MNDIINFFSTDVTGELLIVIKLFAALVLGAFIGYDRERHGKDAGIRTYAAVAMGATIFTAVGAHLVDDVTGSGRIISNVVMGIGFLGAGIIYKNHETKSSQGLTTAATIWCTAAVGVAVGSSMFIIAIASSAALYFLLSLHHQKWYVRWKERTKLDDNSGSSID